MTSPSFRPVRSGAALVSLLLLALVARAQQATVPIQLVFDAEPDKQKEPFNFRTMLDAFPKTKDPAPSRDGLDALHASGSASFSEESLRKIKDRLPAKKFTVIDLRQESHGYLNGLTVEWWGDHNAGNKGKTFDQVQKDENARLAALRASPSEIKRLTMLAGKTRTASDAEAYERADSLFHRTIAEASRNTLFLAFFDTMRISQRDVGWRRLGENAHCYKRQTVYANFHESIAAAIADRNGQEAHLQMQRHLSDVQQYIYEQAFPRSDAPQ